MIHRSQTSSVMISSYNGELWYAQIRDMRRPHHPTDGSKRAVHEAFVLVNWYYSYNHLEETS